MASSPALAALRTLFAALGCLMVATLVYTLLTDGSPFRRELFTPWMVATLVDFYVNVVAIAVWVAYKESSWTNAILWIILLACFGSITTCAYIVKKLYDISSQDLLHNPIRHLLLRNGGEQKLKNYLVVLGKILFTILGVLVLAIVIYTSVTDGLPFRMELLTSWMAATLIDFYINVAAISIWVVHKESTWITALFWILLLICFGSIATCAYIVIQLSLLPLEEPLYRVLLDSHNKLVRSTSAK